MGKDNKLRKMVKIKNIDKIVPIEEVFYVDIILSGKEQGIIIAKGMINTGTLGFYFIDFGFAQKVYK